MPKSSAECLPTASAHTCSGETVSYPSTIESETLEILIHTECGGRLWYAYAETGGLYECDACGQRGRPTTLP